VLRLQALKQNCVNGVKLLGNPPNSSPAIARPASVAFGPLGQRRFVSEAFSSSVGAGRAGTTKVTKVEQSLHPKWSLVWKVEFLWINDSNLSHFSMQARRKP
jgi:hypothetical protein